MTITSKDNIPIEKSFKVEAGPGAGKTEFLVNHIKNVVQNSKRLFCTRKIACITYTNTGVETILNRLGKNVSEKVEVSTIHSFLYRNIVKPYAAFIPEEYKLNYSLLNGHEDLFVNGENIRKWISNTSFDSLKNPNSKNQLLKMPEQFNALKNWILSMQCTYENGTAKFYCNYGKALYITDKIKMSITKRNLDVLSEHLLDLKKLYWTEGKIDHNDVLFFSVILIDKYPFILKVLRAKFPYIFLDEYQDTSPIQAYIIDKIKENETIIGVIGDKVQSIYSFQGANPSLFESFKVDSDCQFKIIQNHRSSKEIIDFLNIIRNDIKQESVNDKSGNKICIIIGDRIAAYQKALEMCKDTTMKETITSLSRENIISNAMKKDIDNAGIDENVFNTYREIDKSGGGSRRRYIESIIHSVELARNGRFKEAIKYLEREFNTNENPKKKALYTLSILLSKYSLYSNGNLMKFYNLVAPLSDKKISEFRKGEVKSFYETTDYQSLAICVNIPEDTSKHITIHKSKGNEFRNILVLGSDEIKQAILKPNLDTNEEHRVAYVAFSRAQDRLFIQFDPEIFSSDDEAKVIEKFNMVEIIKL